METKYPHTIAGLYPNTFSQEFILSSLQLDQERADQMCAMIQSCVGGKLEVRKWGGVGKTGKNLPDYKLQGLTADQLAERKTFAAQKKADREGTSGVKGL